MEHRRKKRSQFRRHGLLEVTTPLLLLTSFLAWPGIAAPTWVPANFLGSLPAGAAIQSSAIDSYGNVLLTGSQARDAFVAKYSADAQNLLSHRLLPNTLTPKVTTDGAGNAFVTGLTTSDQFPTTPGAFQRTLGPQGSAFIMKLDRAGSIVYSTFFGGATANLLPTAIAVNRAGEVFVTGQNGGNLPVTPGGIAIENSGLFTVRLSAAGDRMIYAALGVGGRAIAIDQNDNAYLAGSAYEAREVPLTGNALQKTVTFAICGSTRAFVFPCGHQTVTKIDPAGTKILFCTFVSGSDGEGAASIAVDGRGDIFLAGTTYSTDYPVTAGAFQTRNLAGIPPPPVYHDFFSQGGYWVYPTTGYVTKIAGDGSRILYSTYLGGSGKEAAYAVTVDDTGQASVVMRTESLDFPALARLQLRCLPDRNHGLPVVVRLTAAGDAIRSTTVIEGVAPGATIIAAFDRAGNAIVTGDGPYFAHITDAAATPESLVCMTDSADYVQTASLAPGQLLTLFGAALGSGSAKVLVNGVAATILYSSEEQINFIAPGEIALQPAAIVELIAAAGEPVRRSLRVEAASPALFTQGINGYPACLGKTDENSSSAIVLNPDGAANSCENPTEIGAIVSVFLAGVATPQIFDGYGNDVQRVLPVAGAPPGVWQVEVKLNRPFSGPVGATAIQLVVNGQQVRQRLVPVWLR